MQIILTRKYVTTKQMYKRGVIQWLYTKMEINGELYFVFQIGWENANKRRKEDLPQNEKH